MSFDVAMQRNFYRAHLISLVHASPLLWDKTTVDFNNRLAKMRKWKELSMKLGVSADKIRRTWENLRDQFRRDLKRQLKYGVSSKWRFYDEMSFIRNMVRLKELNEAGGHSAGSDSDDLDTLQEDYDHESLSTIITTHLNQGTTSLNDLPSTSAAAAVAAVATAGVATSVIATTPNFQHVQLATELQTHANGLSRKARRDYQREQLACRQLQEQARQQYDVMKQHKEQKRQLQQLQHVHRQLQQQEYCEQQLLEQKSDSSDEVKFDADFQAEIPELVKIEFDSDSNEPEHAPSFMSSVSPPAAIAAPEMIVPTATIDHKDIVPTPEEEACVTTSASSSRGALKRPRQSDEFATLNEDSKLRLQGLELPDEDYHFVMSILPSLRQIAWNRKLPLRMNIMNLIAQELLEAEEQN